MTSEEDGAEEEMEEEKEDEDDRRRECRMEGTCVKMLRSRLLENLKTHMYIILEVGRKKHAYWTARSNT